MGSKLPELSCIVISTTAYQFSTKTPSSCRSWFVNRHCSCHGSHQFNAPQHLPRDSFTHTQSLHRSPPGQLWFPVNRHI
jgi:hypothetical protein